MQIDIKNNKIIIESLNNKRVLSMLHIWDYDINDNQSTKEISGFKDVEKLIKYCIDNNITYSTSIAVDNLIENRRASADEFENLRIKIKNYKNGIYDKADFIDFTKSVKRLLKPSRQLRDHQLKAAYHLYQIKKGANFSVPGSGKTTVVLIVYELLRSLGLVDTLFVIGPTTCFFAWVNEFKEVIPRSLKYKILAGGDRYNRRGYYHLTEKTPEMFITSFQTLTNDIEYVNKFLLNENVRPFIVIDEAHYIKRFNGQWSNSALYLSNSSDYKCILTGTPMPRSFSDLYNLFDFLWPDSEVISGITKSIITNNDENQQKELITDHIENDVGPLHYRVRKSELGLADQIMHEPIQIPMGKIQKTIYETVYHRYVDLNKEVGLIEELSVLDHLRRARLIRLRQITSHPPLLLNSLGHAEFDEDLPFRKTEIGEMLTSYDNNEISNKAIELLRLIKELDGQNKKVIVWSSFVGTIKYLSKFLTKHGFTNKYVIGEIPFLEQKYKDVESREQIRKEFVDADSGLDVIIANPAAFAESVSLHKGCQNAIYYDLSYNCAHFLQSLDRIHRVGGSENIESHYYFLENTDTIENDIYDNLIQKRNKMYDLIEQDYGIYSLDMEDNYEQEELAAYGRLFNA